MVEEKNYTEAKKLIADYESKQLNIPVVSHTRFLDGIKLREGICDQLLKEVEYLKYDINPIGGRKEIFNTMKKVALEQIIEISSKLDEIRKSLCDCS